MKGCRQCFTEGKECSYDVWDRCVACSEGGYMCWPPINLDELMVKTRELRTLQSDADHLRTILTGKAIKLKSTQEVFLQRRDSLGPASNEADRLLVSQLQQQGRSQRKDIEDDRRKYETMRKSIQEKLEEKEDIAHKLADLVLDRFAQDCERCGELQQVCNFPENSHLCTTCTTDVVRCTGDADWDDLDLMWNAADPLDQQVDDFLLKNLPDPAIFQKLKDNEASTGATLKQYFDRSGLSAQEREESSRLGNQRQQIRDSLEQIRAASFCDNVTYQELLSLRVVLTIAGNAAMRWWSDYDVELEERTGYPTQRRLPSVGDMTDKQYSDAVAWVRAH
ncbi:uncharacterized protein A1O9_13132, partial [Exophiala aquamarina CBS 119918]